MWAVLPISARAASSCTVRSATPSLSTLLNKFTGLLRGLHGRRPGQARRRACNHQPEHMKGKLAVGLIVFYAGSPEEGQEWVRPLKQFGPPEVDLVEPIPYTVVQTLLDPANPPGRNNYWKAENLDESSDEAIDTIVVHAAQIGSLFTQLVILPHGGAISDVGRTRLPLEVGTRLMVFTRSRCGRTRRSRRPT